MIFISDISFRSVDTALDHTTFHQIISHKGHFYLLDNKIIIDVWNSNANINLGNLYHVVAEYNISPRVNYRAEILCQIYHPYIQQIQNCCKLPKMTTNLLAVFLGIYSLVKQLFTCKKLT